MNPLAYKNVKIILKKWGKERIIHNDKDYCFKFLDLMKGFRCSLHCHKIKKETFYVIEGDIVIQLIDKKYRLKKGDFVTILPETFHSFYGIKDSIILEVSTQDFIEDSYRKDSSCSFNFEELKDLL